MLREWLQRVAYYGTGCRDARATNSEETAGRVGIKKFREDAIEQFAPSIPAAGGFDL